MNRQSFIKSFIALLSTSKVLATVNDGNITVIEKKQSSPNHRIKKVIFLKCSEELLKNNIAFKILLEHSAISNEIDLDKPFYIESGYNIDEFINNIKIIVITQYS